MKINFISEVDIDKFMSVLHRNTHDRFNYKIEVLSTKPGRKYAAKIEVRDVRLNESKYYCGNHPNECEVGIVPRNPRRANFLEGADWVDWNDRVNDALDELHADANVRTAVCILRKGTKRRVKYGSHMRGNFWQWDLDTTDIGYQDWRGHIAPASVFPYGTPGEYKREVKPVPEYNCNNCLDGILLKACCGGI